MPQPQNPLTLRQGEPQVMARTSSSWPPTVGGYLSNSWVASQRTIVEAGVPEDYVNAMLDNDYMEQVVTGMHILNTKRKKRSHYFKLMNRVLLWFLIIQALVGLFFFLMKVMQPDTLMGVKADFQSVDMVIMLSAAGHLRPQRQTQAASVRAFSDRLHRVMAEHVEHGKYEAVENVRRLRGRDQTYMEWLLEPAPRYTGGHLRMTLGHFNDGRAATFNKLTRQQDQLDIALSSLSDSHYGRTSHLLPAMQECYAMVKDNHYKTGFLPGDPAHPESLRFCVIIGDDEAMCDRPHTPMVESYCSTEEDEDFCPHIDDRSRLGNQLEAPEENQRCIEFVKNEFACEGVRTNATWPLKLLLLFTVGSDEEKQLRLSNPMFQKFITETTGCQIESKIRTVIEHREHGDFTRQKQYWELDNETCHQFVFAENAYGLDALANTIETWLTNSNVSMPKKLKETPFPSWIFLIPLMNLLMYLLWTQIVKMCRRVQTKVKKVAGAKKKMIKVTKAVVEKRDRSGSAERILNELSEMEMAEMQQLRAPVELGQNITLRARLKGGYVRTNAELGVPDGHGLPNQTESDWVFEATDGTTEGAVLNGMEIRLKNAQGDLLCTRPDGTTYVAAPGSEGAGEAVYVIQGPSGEGPVRLGDALLVKSLASGACLRVGKDGTCDGEGGEHAVEAQFAVDLGGRTIRGNAIVTLTSEVNGWYLAGTPEGQLNAKQGNDPWRFWKLERQRAAGQKEPPSSFMGNAVSNISMASAYGSGAPGPLKHGDIVILRAFNQYPVEVDAKGGCHCGGRAAAAEREAGEAKAMGRSASSSAPAGGAHGAADGPLIKEFVIEKVGMGLHKKHDQTLRAGALVSLRPVLENEADARQLLRVGEDGDVSADGRVNQREISFILDLAAVQQFSKPLNVALAKGDNTIKLQTLWNKGQGTNISCVNAGWNTEEDIHAFKGQVVVAGPGGGYTVPKAIKGEDQGWVASVGDNVNIFKAAEQAKRQGAKGLIVRCSEPMTIKKMLNKEGGTPPLPTIYVDDNASEELKERGIVLKGCDYTKKALTEALRTMGDTSEAEVFKAAGRCALEAYDERHKVAEQAPAAPAQMMEVVAEDEEQGNFKWKVKANTHYLWGKTGGGATVMNVNFGKAAPPSALKKTKLNQAGQEVVDASVSHNLVPRAQQPQVFESSRRSVTESAVIDSELFRNRAVTEEMAEVLSECAFSESALPQLADSSDFKIEYKFEEVEVGLGDTVEEIDEEEILHNPDEGQAMDRFAVAPSQFWIVALGMVASTLAFCALVGFLLWKIVKNAGSEEDADVAAAALSPPQHGLHEAASPLLYTSRRALSESVAAGLRGFALGGSSS